MAIDTIMVDTSLKKWQDILRLRDWDIISRIVDVEWRKSGDIKIDESNKMAVVLINNNAIVSNLEEIIIHELLHLKLWGMDQMIEGYVNIVFGVEEKDSKREFAMNMFFKELESTVEDLTKGYLEANGGEKPCTNRLEKMIKEEIG
ncbi:hypothetical protein [Clostridium sp.]|uniref:hypothetical protein n=1 Tax=Clostridium sp. TaxID=1506 RepID=UPI003D6D88C9